jgi:hypothetical protein
MAKVAFTELLAILNKPVADPAVQAVLKKAGKVKLSSDFIVAEAAGFDISLDEPVGVTKRTKKVTTMLFLFADGEDKHVGYADLPKPFKFAPDRASLIAKHPPDESWNLDDGDVPITSTKVERDTWNADGFEINANYSRKTGVVRYFTVSLPEELRGGRDIATHPLHFESSPADPPPDAELMGMALIAAWSVDRCGLTKKHAAAGFAKILPIKSPLEFLKAACNSTLTTLDVDPSMGDFLYAYTNNTAEPKRWYVDDFVAAFKVLKNPSYVPDSREAVDRIAPILDARRTDFNKTKFKGAPDKKALAAAIKLRDAVKINPRKATLVDTPIDDHFASELLGMIDTLLSDKQLRALFARAKLPIGKTIDTQANPALGISYLGSRPEGTKPSALRVEEVTFFAAKQRDYVRGMGKEVEFRAYPSLLPMGLVMGATRDEVIEAFGKPRRVGDDHAVWFPAKNRQIAASFKNGKLVRINFGKPADWEPAPKGPYGPKHVF